MILSGQILNSSKVFLQKKWPGVNQMTYRLKANAPTEVKLPWVVYNHSQAKVNGHRVPLLNKSRGLAQVKLPPGVSQVRVFYPPSGFYKISWLVVFATLVVWLGSFLKRKQSNRF